MIMELSTYMTNPTGLSIRSDTAGHGYYKAKRGKRTHKGTDYLCVPGQAIYSPIAGKIIRKAYPYSDKSYEGVVIDGKFFTIKMFYFKPFVDLIGKTVSRGEHIGTAQDISKRYPGPMQPHIHLQVDRVDPNIFIGA